MRRTRRRRPRAWAAPDVRSPGTKTRARSSRSSPPRLDRTSRQRRIPGPTVLCDWSLMPLSFALDRMQARDMSAQAPASRGGEALSRADLAWLNADVPTNHFVVTSLALFDEPLDIERFKTVLAHRVALHPRLTQVVSGG